MNVRELIAEVERRGGRFELLGDRLRATPRAAVTPELYEAIGARKPEIVSELRKREAQNEAEAVILAQRLLRGCGWPASAPVCDFLIGHPGERCRRCGAPWLEHYAPESS